MAAAAYEAAMRRALALAAHGPATGVNPRVGCVILDADGAVIAEGWHRGAGTPHAEIDALGHLEPGDARGSTVVVTLEPCNHTGRTGPCSVALIEAGVARVVYAASDPGVRSGGGARRLHDAGVEVIGGVLGDEVERFLGDWLPAARLGRPFVTLKWASSLDGRTAAADGTSKWIIGAAARQRVHEQREASDAIIVGTATVLSDDPSLTARGDAGELMPRQPMPVVVGVRQIPSDAAVFRHPHAPFIAPTHDLAQVLDHLFGLGVRRAFVEGGPTLATAFLAAGLVDELVVYLAPSLLGGPHTAIADIGVGTIAEARRLEITGVERLGNDLMIVAHPRDGGTILPATRPDPSRPLHSMEEES
ncbi:bifunctional diaminohydroxyphosphoribosylaminopyrimidine deaminase/5-amino-6-(5-phosphoribosylamino)uracil reductase RibD [Microbacterium sp. STN6]|uniref:bifunctional diaminohydroxyphosphoribosylaminopyrimidine deaminase/5-amino-6-(5-phosphoribosylamino)uracil reductase RibD n=1 Tax=Microbacterium sp. STN6 TaxID=2995588 RepID=UPI0022609D0F|nr:bifunctional diaminohydroxyphosphoribosylaminopyrimidine deaminase/5-amino-6-(5-phosphoribosylamino)uracil reductase RibD [Microbacterium sp. STN6]MCX7520952.1 bifunctional diaminohydroxyphosphoribosylaminopyrimidine deaminase/5-amino-6-(5-phosphoribosylamino)uracil reductase RibD [Microbacterium sp. STN6]